MKFLIFFILINTKDYLEVKFYENGISFDGEVDSIWGECDSILVEKQFYPYYDSLSTYKTVIKAIQDKENIYFLVKINYGNEKPRTELSGSNDEVTIYIDPHLSRVNAYYFEISLDGSRNDGIVTQDGRNMDYTWDGVWENKAKIFKNSKGEYLFVSEIRIPFKTISFSRDKDRWGFQVKTYFYKTKENNYFILPEQSEKLRVSKFGFLKKVKPFIKGYGIEFFPVVLYKNEYYSVIDESIRGRFNPWIGLDVFYRKEKHTLNITFFPDFAEIESDPFKISFGKYEIYYSERRPFFVEGRNIFSLSGFGHGFSFYHPVEVFYSRRIGRKMRDGTGEVPIITGIKYTYTSNKQEIGFLNVITGRKEGIGDTAYTTLWNVLRFKRYYFLNSETGIFLNYKKNLEKDYYYFCADIDGALRWERNQIAYQIVSSVRDRERTGFLYNIGGNVYLTEKVMFLLNGEYANDFIDISDMGYQSFYPGDRSFSLGLSYSDYPKKGRISSYSLWTGGGYFKEGYEEKESVIGSAGIWTSLRNPYIRISLNTAYGKGFEMDTEFIYKSFNFNFSIHLTQFSLWSGAYAYYDWNYLRNFLAWVSGLWGGMFFPLGNRFSFSLNFNTWMEWDTLNTYISTIWSNSIYFTFVITPFMDITLYLNPVSIIEREKIYFPYFRTAVYYEWEVKPKSKIHIVYNHLFNRKEEIYTTSERISAFKIRWVFLF